MSGFRIAACATLMAVASPFPATALSDAECQPLRAFGGAMALSIKHAGESMQVDPFYALTSDPDPAVSTALDRVKAARLRFVEASRDYAAATQDLLKLCTK